MLKIERDLAVNKNPHITVIANHLLENAKNDNLIKENLNKENKSLDEMYKYIRSEAQKKVMDGMAMIDDPTVYGWAQHYYDEDGIVLDNPTTEKSKIVPVELPEEDIGAFDI